MVKFCDFFIKLLFIMQFCDAVNHTIDLDASNIMPDLYNIYMEVVGKDENATTRRVLRGSNRYLIHIEKLKNVNGVKTHNLIVTGDDNKTADPIVYIDNPIESHIPHAYITREQFKKDLLNDIRKQKIEFHNQQIKKKLNKFIKEVKYTAKKTVSINTTLKRVTNLKKVKHKKTITTKEVVATEKDIEIFDTSISTFPEIVDTTTDVTTMYIETEEINSNFKSSDESATPTFEPTEEIYESTTHEPTEEIYESTTHEPTEEIYESTTHEPTKEITTILTEKSTTAKETEETYESITLKPTEEIATILNKITTTEETESTTETTTISTPRTRGRPYVFIGNGFNKEYESRT